MGGLGGVSYTSTKALTGTALNSAPAPAPSVQTQAPVPPPLQKSTMTPEENLQVPTSGGKITLSGKFITELTNISLNGQLLPAGSWSQSAGTITVTIPAGKGIADLQLFNGEFPLLPAQKFTFVSPTPVVAPTPTPSPTVKPEPTPTVSPTPEATTKPIKKSESIKIYFGMNSSQIDGASKNVLTGLVERIALIGNVVVTVTGYVQPTKVNPNEQSLSLNRARAVIAELKGAGIQATFIAKAGGSAPKNAPSSRYALVEVVSK
jgi:outer membrane protein OmpA-like peptidoglycan-associated protein